MALSTNSSWATSRDDALQALTDFLPRVPAYARERNFDRPGHLEVSRLSPYLRRRLISEEEVTTEVLRHHSFQSSEKFLQEVAWRTYWKGWLEKRPEVWLSYLEQAARLEESLDEVSWGALAQRAQSGQTVLSFFNDWVTELTSAGYLHNHTRMWFASVWIFTLKLPWQLGAHFMYQNLLDGDPASNTLSWRWVAGLQTPGKFYLAQADNISRYSEGRWTPRPHELAQEAFPIFESPPSVVKDTPPSFALSLPDSDIALVVTAEDLSIEQELEKRARVQSIALLAPFRGSERSPHVNMYVTSLLDDTARRLSSWVGQDKVTRVSNEQELASWIQSLNGTKIVMVPPSTGPETPWLRSLKGLSPDAAAFFRGWDLALYPLAQKGFFPFWERARAELKDRYSPRSSLHPT